VVRKKLKSRPQWQKASFGWSGAAFVQDGRIYLDFEYSPERVNAVKKIGSAKFHKESKSWSLPVDLFEEVSKSEQLKSFRFYYNESQIFLSEAERVAERQKAEKYVSLNPFVVPLEIFNQCVVDVELHLNLQRRSFVLKPKYRSESEKELKKINWLIPSKRESGYILPAHKVSEMISKLRDLGISFAVTEEAGLALKETASLRSSLLELSRGKLEEFHQAFLNPVCLKVEDPEDHYRAYQLIGWSPEHLQLLFPNSEGFLERKKIAEALSESDLSELLLKAHSLKMKIFLDTSVEESLTDTLKKYQTEKTEAHENLVRQNEVFQSLSDFELEDSLLGSNGVAAKLFPHQRVAVEWLSLNDRALLGDDMGLGKTVSVLSTFERLLREEKVDHLLVVCPNSLKRNWIREMENWFPERKLLLLPETKAERAKFFRHLRLGARKCDGLVLNYEAVRLPAVLEELEAIFGDKKVFLCLDESQRVKNSRSKSFQALSRLSPKAARRVLLSGTPIPKDLSDIWSQVYLLDDGERFGKNFFRWLTQVAEIGNKYSEFAVKKFKSKESKEVIARVRELLLRRKKEDVLSLPEKTFTSRDIELSGDQKKFYEEVRKELLLRVTSLTGDTFLREIQNVLEEYLRAVQVASNPRLVDPTWTGEPAKFLECDEIIREVVEEGGGKIVLWTNYLLNVEELTRRYEHLGSAGFSGEVKLGERDRIVKEFQTGQSIKVLVAVPAAGGVGITLTASQTAVYLDKTWNAEHFLQSVDRVHRIGQKGTVSIISLHASKVDELISYNLRRKERNMRQLLGDEEGGAAIRSLTKEELRKALSETG